MKIIRHPEKGKLRRPVVALGTFDGVHVGHKRVIEAAVRHARRLRSHAAVITFDPHPQEIVAPGRGLRLLTTLQEREEIFARLGADAVVVSIFTRQLQKLSSQEYVSRYLVRRLGVRHVFVGYDYTFGRGRTGSPAELKKLGGKYGFAVTVMPPVKVGRRIVKSSAIRALLSDGDFSTALKMLGHPYRLTGKVVKGVGRGKILGYPTANLKVDPRKLIPAQGIYAGFADGKKCVVYIGSRPTFGAGKTAIEAHILNFDRNIRGRTIQLDLFARLRGDRQFADTSELKAQIKKDILAGSRFKPQKLP
ncbi:riboflavin biosynthesis protein RibF [candidate division WOR-1 bacterium RIFCSPHIGHO2_01_FULL_53_15]|uniref:Riboflavin biosynthesis protein n=1 Tax=candidate division WOR-1 bacterium RIFCSPHIGHO2_01_FULL_53_15 TaxID=1802564 RepID=A0A1F4Q0V7_UNCSA|nr:MAG: riboflavin biosynthesis protein RibF [candidate division WOR-1 bacterium RIFCSPHIGHO2_01_FULL_53_15]OGC13020.1 MAG: riboflavin biosynthesis protein RibF [candidate division WOR-1 bacterium RIFCSPHIGHO2_02_FULL_53_26]